MTMQEFDKAMTRCGEVPRLFAGPSVVTDPTRHSANFAAIEAEIDAPKPGLLARVLLRLGVSEDTVPLVTATPALRRSWIASVGLAMLFALTSAGSNTGEGADRIVVFLTLAPLLPLAGVALAFGPKVDPTYEVALAAPIDGFRLFLIRAMTVLGGSTLGLLIMSALMPSGGLQRIAWLLPALATTSLAMALSTRFDPLMAAASVGAVWLLIVTMSVSASSVADAFGPVMQVVSAAIASAGAIALGQRRRRLDITSDR